MSPSDWYERWEEEAADGPGLPYGGRPPAGEREMMPEGRHDLRIVQAKVEEEKISFRLAHEDKRFGYLFLDLWKDNEKTRDRMANMAGALRMTPAAWGEALREGDLAGRIIRAEVRHWYNEKTDRTKPVVRFFMAADEVPFAKQEPAEQPKAPPPAKAPVWEQDGDIPF